MTSLAFTAEQAAASEASKAWPFEEARRLIKRLERLPGGADKTVLFETGFLSNKEDAEFLASPAGQKKLARGVRDAVQVHFARRITAR